jgi:chemotaxis protein methyltransferase CheR
VQHAQKTSDVMAQFRSRVRQATGITLPPTKSPMIHQRLKRCVITTGAASTEEFLHHVLTDPSRADDLRAAIDLITTNTTSFFREAQHFTFLTETILPECLAQPGRTRLKLWSAASSEGAEAFTMAMVLAEAQRNKAGFDFAILGTDISTRMIEKANQAVFSQEQLAGIPPALQNRYFLTARDPRHQNEARVVPELRARVRFRQMNLMDDSYPLDKDITAAFLRNVLIYFEPDDQRQVVNKVVRHLAPGGYLIVGHSESMAVQHTGMKQIVPTIFRKV